jgi:hypothetical protein
MIRAADVETFHALKKILGQQGYATSVESVLNPT